MSCRIRLERKALVLMIEPFASTGFAPFSCEKNVEAVLLADFSEYEISILHAQ